MSWHYQFVLNEDGMIGVVEVYDTEDGIMHTAPVNPLLFESTHPEPWAEISGTLGLLMLALSRNGVVPLESLAGARSDLTEDE